MPNTDPVRPVPFRGRTEQILPKEANILQNKIQKVVSLSSDKKNLLCPLKTKAMIFNHLKKYNISA